MSIHLKDSNPTVDDIELRKNRRRAVKNIMHKLRALGLRKVFWIDNNPEEELKGNEQGGKIRLVTSRWDDRPGKRR